MNKSALKSNSINVYPTVLETISNFNVKLTDLPKKDMTPHIAQFVKANPTEPDPSAIPLGEINIPDPGIKVSTIVKYIDLCTKSIFGFRCQLKILLRFTIPPNQFHFSNALE